MDYAWIRKIILGLGEYKNCTRKKLSDVTIEINPGNVSKVVRIYGINAWGSLVDTYVGAGQSKIDTLFCNGVNVDSYLSVGNNYIGEGIRTDNDVQAAGEIYSGYGTSSQLSITDVNNNVNKIRGQAVISVNSTPQQSNTGNKVTIWSLGGKKLSHGFYIVIVSAVIQTSRYTSALRFYGNSSVIASGVTKSQTGMRVMAVGNFGVSGTQSFDFYLQAEGQDAGTSAIVPAYQTYNILVVKVG